MHSRRKISMRDGEPRAITWILELILIVLLFVVRAALSQ